MRRFFLLGIFIQSILCSPVCAEFELHVWNKGAADFDKSMPGEDTFTNHGEFKLQASAFEDLIKFGLEVDIFYNYNDLDNDVNTDVRPYETYLELDSDQTLARIGYQIVRWGKTDEISPFDVITAEDFRDGFVRVRSERKISTPMIFVEHYFEESTLEFIVKPIFQSDRYDFADSDWALLGNFRGQEEPFVDIAPTGGGLSEVSVGGRYSFSFGDFDLALDAYSGISGAPNVVLASEDGSRFLATYDRLNFVGLEAERELGSYILRFDAMFSFNEVMSTSQLQRGRGDFLRYVIGLEREFENTLLLNAQFGQLLRLSSEDYMETLLEHTEGLFLFSRYSLFENEIALGARAFIDLRNAHSYLNPYLVLHDRGDWNVELGADLMIGAFRLFLQEVGENDQGYVIINYKI